MAGNYTRINTERGQSEKPKSKKTEIQDPIYAQFSDAFHHEAEQMDANFKCRKKKTTRNTTRKHPQSYPSTTTNRRQNKKKTRTTNAIKPENGKETQSLTTKCITK